VTIEAPKRSGSSADLKPSAGHVDAASLELAPVIPACPPDRARKPIMMINISITPQATV
jgi:hypothetical protein